MKSYTEPSVVKLHKIISKELMPHHTILHYTGNMFGIGCRISEIETINKIKKLKKRDDNNGLIVLVADYQWFEEADISVPDRLQPILEQYWPGNLTVVFECSDPMFSHLSINGKVAFRVPGDPMLRAMIEMIGEPIISTSINISGLPAENDYKRIQKNYETWFDMAIVPNPKHLSPQAEPSTVIEFITAATHSGSNTAIKCLREGSIPFFGIQKSFEIPLVMFVCTANICRSPIAEYLFSHYISKEKLPYIGDSSGLMSGGSMISVNSLQLLLAHGITEAQLHISQQITPELVSSSWLILTMEQRQRDYLRQQAPNASNKIFTLNEIVGESGDIEDPYGSNLESYEITYEIIEDRIKRLIEKIKNKTIRTKEQ